MNEPQLGKLIPKDEEQARDAVHVAIVPITAGHTLRPGERFGFENGNSQIAYRTVSGFHTLTTIGIVDPFLREKEVLEGDRFWGFLLPNTVTGMRHFWQHPAFKNETVSESNKDRSKKWLREFCDRYYTRFDYLIEQVMSGTDICLGDDRVYDIIHNESEMELLWTHLEIYTGKTFSEEHRDDVSWRCGC